MLALALVAAVVVCSVAVSAPRTLPLYGTTDRGQEWRLRPGKPVPDDDVASSWCLRLDYTTDVVLENDKYTGGLAACGRRPTRRISGIVAVDCERGSVFVFGAVRRVHDVRLRNRRALRREPTFASLPPRVRFGGRSFIVVIDIDQLPARLTGEGAGKNPIVRIPRRSKICRPHRGAPKGGEPFLDFESRK